MNKPTATNLKWELVSEVDQQQLHALREKLPLSIPMATLLLQRGIDTYDKAKEFFNPSLKSLHDPFLMQDMAAAVDRLTRAIQQQEKILIYGDYDVDGTTAVALMATFLRNHTSHIDTYIPDRYAEGYGISKKGIEYAQESGVKLIIALDCGIKALEQAQLATEASMDLIICDHHTPGEQLPSALAVLDPKRKDCAYPYKELTGCGVGFKLLEAYCLRHRIDRKELWPLLDLLAVSIAADIVPITGENRILCYYGLKQLNRAPRAGFKALIENAALKTPFKVSSLVFGLAPRINAAGRIKHGKDAVALLCEQEAEAATEKATAIGLNNDQRREYDSAITEEALAMIESQQLEKHYSTVLFKEDWHKGVIGIVASRCIEHYYRPTIILTESNGKATGSARSVSGFSVYEALCECADLMDKFGGHDFAAGMTLPIENVPKLQKRFESIVRERIDPDLLIPRIHISTEVTLEQLTPNFYKTMSRMAPFGPSNRSPVFIARQVWLAAPPRLLKEQHVKMYVKQKDSTVGFDAILFRNPEVFHQLTMEEPFDICFTLEENTFNSRTNLQLLLKDVSWK